MAISLSFVYYVQQQMVIQINHDLNVLLKQEQKKQRRLALKGTELTVDDTDVWFIIVFDLSWTG